MDIKEKLKNIKFIRNIGKKHNIKKEFKRDAHDFCNYYMYAGESENQLEYEILFLVHSLEKGMSYENLRPFGKKKCHSLINLLEKYSIVGTQSNSAYRVGISILQKMKELYILKKWNKDRFYQEIEEFLNKSLSNVKLVDVGSTEITNGLFEIEKSDDFLSFIKKRHSVRKFAEKKLNQEDIKYCVEAAISAPSACNRQMCKVYQVSDGDKKALLDDKIIGVSGFDKKWINYFVFTFDMSAFSFYGERNQGYFNVGLFAMNFVNALHFKGIGSCFLQWSNTGKDDVLVRQKLGIPANERITVVLAAGYYPEKCKIPISHRKDINECFKVIE